LDVSTADRFGVTALTQSATTTCPADVIGTDQPQRKLVEAFVAKRFLDVHGAQIIAFMPQFLALFDDEGAVQAAVGMRDAGCERFFLEYYLDYPVEQVIAEQAAPPAISVERDRVVEIGNLASIDRRASRRLFKLLARRLSVENYQWAVFTGCSSLQRMFVTIGIETVDLGRALQSQLPGDQQTWGGYYEDNPQVVAGRVGLGREVFDRLAVAS
jgi:hypothetical protein